MAAFDTTPHSFHIPVMGTGFTMDTPLRVAHLGISSVVSLGDDGLMEKLRRYHSERLGLAFAAIGKREPEGRARRITAWLDFLDAQVQIKSAALRAAPLEPGSELTRYFELLPEGALKAAWRACLALPAGPAREAAEAALRAAALPGAINVNIMTKVDRSILPSGEALGPEGTDAVTGLKGFARSTLASAVVFSAGINPRLYGAMTPFVDFFPDAQGAIKKHVILKVSDWRSAEVQGRFLAKKGIWVDEFRVESGLNCGGHAFATQGQLLGPILAEFNERMPVLNAELKALWAKALAARGQAAGQVPPPFRLTVQGGVGTAAEHALLIKAFHAQSVGWGSPFLLVAEASLVDDPTRALLAAAGEDGIVLSDASPLGIPFWCLAGSSSEAMRLKRIAEGKPGSPCPQAALAFNTEFGPIPKCTASRDYQSRKLEQVGQAGLPAPLLEATRQLIMARACICVELGGGALRGLGLDQTTLTTVCPGPNLAWFKRLASLEEMVGHIYGRSSLFGPEAASRPHVLLAELKITVDYLLREAKRHAEGLAPRSEEYFSEYAANLLKGIEYYCARSEEIFGQKRAQLEAATAEFRAKAESFLPGRALPAVA
jgi:NAD(P)H-dependent flavin oxidoreductase YrpB (nitropropane dioxygenase family)